MTSRSRKFPLVPILIAAAVVLLAGAWLAFRPIAPDVPRGNLSGADIGGPFTLVDETGKTVTSDSFNDQWRMMYFGFTFCPDVCPTDTAAMAAGLKAFEERHPGRATRVQPMFITFDPERDTPEVLAEFTDHFHPRLLGLTGTQQQVDDALKAFRVYAVRTPGATEGSYSFDHTALVYLMDPQGRPVEFIANPTPQTVDTMLEKFVH